MFVNYEITPSMFASGTTASTISIPITIDYQIVDNSELIERVFVDTEVAKSINPILDYEKVRFIPVHADKHVDNITYSLNFLKNGSMASPTFYADIEFDNDDIKFERNNFKESFVNLGFYDSPNNLTQNLVTEIEIYSMLTDVDRYGYGSPSPIIPGQPKPSNQIPVRFILSNPLTTKGFYEGYHIYNYKDEYVIGTPKYLYMKATYFNAKNGKTTNLITEPNAYKIDELLNKVYTRYKLYRDSTGFYYEIDDTYSSNIVYQFDYTSNKPDITVNLYQIQVI